MGVVDKPSLGCYLPEHLSPAILGASSCVSQMTSGSFAITRAQLIDLQLPAAESARLCRLPPCTWALYWGSETDFLTTSLCLFSCCSFLFLPPLR